MKKILFLIGLLAFSSLGYCGDIERSTGFTRSAGTLTAKNSMIVKGTASSTITGSINPTASTSVTGVGTLFTTELKVGDSIDVNSEIRQVTAIASDTALTVMTEFTDTANDTSIVKYPAELILQNSAGTTNVSVGYDGALTAPKINGVIYIDGIKYPKTSDGVQAAVDSVATGTSQKIVLTAGQYDWTSAVTWTNKGIHIEGEARNRCTNGTYIKVNASFSGGSVFCSKDDIAIAFNNRPRTSFKWLNIDSTSSSAVDAAIEFNGTVGTNIEGCRIIGAMTKSGIILDTAPSCPVTYVYIHNTAISNVTYGLHYKDTGNNYHTAIYVDGGSSIRNIYGSGSAVYAEASAYETTLDMQNTYIESGTTAIGTGRSMISCAATRFQVRCTNVNFDTTGSDYSWDLTNKTDISVPTFLNCRLYNGSGAARYIDSPLVPSYIVDSRKGVRQGKAIYIPVGGSISTYFSEASNGDTLILGVGTYTMTSQITWSKNVSLVGAAVGQSIINATINASTNGAIMIATTDPLLFKNFTLNYSHSGYTLGGAGIYSGASVNTGISIEDVEINASTTSATHIAGITVGGSIVVCKNVTVNAVNTTTNGNANGVYVYCSSSAVTSGLINLYNCKATTASDAGASSSSAFAVYDDGTTVDHTMNLFNCEGIATGSLSSRAVFAYQNNSKIKIYSGIYNGATYDLFQGDGATIAIYDAILVNGTTSGTITYAGTFATNNLALYGNMTSANIPTYADNATAVSGGLAVGTFYKTATGEIRIVV